MGLFGKALSHVRLGRAKSQQAARAAYHHRNGNIFRGLGDPIPAGEVDCQIAEILAVGMQRGPIRTEAKLCRTLRGAHGLPCDLRPVSVIADGGDGTRLVYYLREDCLVFLGFLSAIGLAINNQLSRDA